MDKETKQLLQELIHEVKSISRGGSEPLGFEALCMAICGGYPGERGTGFLINELRSISNSLDDISKSLNDMARRQALKENVDI